MGYNKFVVGSTTKLDLSSDTVDAASVLSGKTFHDHNGDPQVGTYDPGTAFTAILKIDTYNRSLFGRDITITKIRDWDATLNISTANKDLFNREIEVDK